MNPSIKAKLEKSWATIFYEHVFCNIDEKPFSVLYSDIGRPNFPVNILLSLEYIKHLKNYSAVKSIPENHLTENLKEVLTPEFKTQTIYKSKPFENETRLDMLLNLCLEAKNIIENIPDMQHSDVLRILNRFMSEQAFYDKDKECLKAKDKKSISSDSSAVNS
ncbi:hypothetical protein M1N61_01765 [Peptococcaceae bacterium]|nr:hypothetical protein [Peptococcaceae bacterium]